MTPDQLIDYVARVESGGSYTAWTSNDNGAGISFGLIQFNQRKGSLPTLLQRREAKDPPKFAQIFGGKKSVFLNERVFRQLHFQGDPWKSFFTQMGEYPPFQEVQRELAQDEYLEPARKLLHKHSLSSEKALAMLFDLSIQYGVTGAENKLQKAIEAVKEKTQNLTENEILVKLAELSDTHDYDNQRRHRILVDEKISSESA